MERTYPISKEQKHPWIERLITLFGLIGAVIFFAQYDRALPSASVDVSITRPQAQQIAADYLNSFGYIPGEGYKSTLSFGGGGLSLIYLQRTLGVETFNRRLVAEKWPIYRWTARWFKPEKKEEFYVYLSPSGEFLGFDHIIMEDAPGAAIPLEQAQDIAKNFLAQYAGWDPAAWERIEASSEEMPGGRVDHRFTWKLSGFSAGESEIRYTATVQGDRVGYAFPWMKAPETFERQFAAERDLAGFVNNTAYFLGLGTLALVAIAALATSRPDLRRAIPPTALAMLVTLAAYLNYSVLYNLGYDTTDDYTLFWVDNFISILFITLFAGGPILVGWAGGQALSKLTWPTQDRILTRGPNRWVSFSRSAWRGLRLGAAQLGFIIIFYFVTTEYFGWWNPVTAEYSDLFATPIPFVEAFRIGLLAALQEELLFRLIGISLFMWIFRKRLTWLAVLIPGLLWAFAHTGYLTYPIYARGVELTIVAVVFGYIFLKFDLLTTIMSHFTYNMMVVGIFLLRSSEPYYQFSGWIVVAALFLPLLPGLFETLARSRQKDVPSPDSLTLRPATQADIPSLAGLPVKADWEALLAEPGRRVLVLTDGDELTGFATGCVQSESTANVDGVYVVPKWQRQYWGTIMLEALREDFQNEGISEVRAALRLDEREPMAFLFNRFWRPYAQVMSPEDSPEFGRMVKTGLRETLKVFRKEKQDEAELEIPRDLI
jgi:hypothetical protein